MTTALTDARATWSRFWTALSPRDRRAATLAIAVVGLLALWLLGIRPAWQATRALPVELQRLDAQWQQMQRQAAEVRSLRGAPAVPTAQAAAALRAATQEIGDGARLAVTGDRATLTVTDAAGDELQRWLQLAREAARARPVELNLVRNAQGNFGGSVVVALPGAPR